MQGRTKVIAVIDDEPLMLEAIEQLLTAYCFTTVIFSSAEEFLSVHANTEASCLLVDINLGGMSGIELQRRLKASGSQLPIIFMTGADNDATRREATEAGCVAYLCKPFPDHLLIDAIGKAIG
jgi:FixJ family two-component response regulator